MKLPRSARASCTNVDGRVFQDRITVPGGAGGSTWDALGADRVNVRRRSGWIGCGTDDTRYNGHLDLVDLLKSRGIRATWHSTPGGHEWKVWRHQLAAMLPALFTR